MEKHTAIVDLKDGYALKMNFTMPDDDIDVDSLLRIDLSNIAAEIVTIPVAIHKFGILKAEANNAFNIAKMNLSVFESKQRQKVREEAVGKVTIQEIEDTVTSSSAHISLKKLMFKKQKEAEYIESINWALKTKSDKLDKISINMNTGDIYDALIASKLKHINFTSLKLVKPLIQ